MRFQSTLVNAQSTASQRRHSTMSRQRRIILIVFARQYHDFARRLCSALMLAVHQPFHVPLEHRRPISEWTSVCAGLRNIRSFVYIYIYMYILLLLARAPPPYGSRTKAERKLYESRTKAVRKRFRKQSISVVSRFRV